MGLFLADPNVERLPPADIRFLDLQAEPNPDGKRLRITLNMTPFQEKPNIELNLTDPAGVIAASVSIVEPVTWKMEITMHIRYLTSNASENNPASATVRYTLSAFLSYSDLGEVDHRNIFIEMPSPVQ